MKNLLKPFFVFVLPLLGTANLSYANPVNRNAVLNTNTFSLQEESAEFTPSAQSVAQYSPTQRSGLLLPGEVPVSELLPSSMQDLPPPFAANLFAGGYETERHDGLNDDYLIAAGDKLSIKLWGAINLADVVTVDNQGNIFLPNIGPIQVINTPASKINAQVTAKLRTVYKSNVDIYVNLLTATPVSVYLSGAVIRPGQYAGIASDSLLYFLKRAGGIDSERGSYRSVRVMRGNKTLLRQDLYDFIQKGQLSRVNFKDGDVIFVDSQKATVSVSGLVKNPFRFEMGQEMQGAELLALAKPYANVSHVGVMGVRSGKPFSTYLTIDAFKHFMLTDGDKLIFNNDLRAQVLDIQLSGNYLGPSYYAVNKNTKLHSLLAQISIEKELSDYKSIYILRQSVAQRQKEMIEESLNSLERSVFTAPASSDGEAAIRAKEAEMVLRFTERARQVEPLGRVVVASQGKVANILLEQGDTIVIPAKSDLIQIGGEVVMPQAVVFNPNARVKDYIAWAGGFTERANYKNPLVIRANGMVEYGDELTLQPGDQIMILPRVDSKTMQTVKDITQIVYQIAVAANVVTSL